MFKTSQNCNSVKNVIDFTGVSRLLGNNSVIPFLTAAKKRHFYPPKLPALRAEVDGRTQKSVRPFSCFAACGSFLRRKLPAGVPSSALVAFAALPHVGATSSFLAFGGYALGCVRKAAQTADTGATGWDWLFGCALNQCFR